jgi:ankyrin repeat protein
VLQVVDRRKKVEKYVVLFAACLAAAGCATVSRTGTAPAPRESPVIFELLEGGTPDDLRSAIAGGADVNALDPDGNSVLMDACAMQDYELVPVLIEAGADVNARSLVEGRTALMWAVMYYEVPDNVFVLLDAGADATARDKAGKSVLDYARENWRFAGTEAMRRLEQANR